MVCFIMAELWYLVTCRAQLHGLCAQMQCYFTHSPDMSTFMEDVRLVRPTEMLVPPRITSMLYDRFQEMLAARSATSLEDKERQRQVDLLRFLCTYVLIGARHAFVGHDTSRSEGMGAVVHAICHSAFEATKPRHCVTCEVVRCRS